MKKILSIILIMSMITVMTGCGSSSTASRSESSTETETVSEDTSENEAEDSDEVYTLSMQISWTTGGGLYTYCYKPWIDAVEEATGGRLQIELYDNNGLTDPTEALEALRQGIVDICEIDTPMMAGLMNLYDASAIADPTVKAGSPFSTVLWKLYESCADEMNYGLDGLKTLFIWTPGPSYYLSTKKIETADDLKDLKVWASGTIACYGYELVGAVPITTSFSEIYNTYEKGIVDAVCQAPITSYDNNLWGLSSYVNQINVGYGMWPVLISESAWNKLPTDIQEALASVSGEYAAELFDSGITEAVALYKEENPQIEWVELPEEEQQKINEMVTEKQYEAWVEYTMEQGFDEESIRKVYETFRSLESEYCK